MALKYGLGTGEHCSPGCLEKLRKRFAGSRVTPAKLIGTAGLPLGMRGSGKVGP